MKMLLFTLLVFLTFSPFASSKCYFSAFYISAAPSYFVDCNFPKGNFCYAKASVENSTLFRYGCDTSKRITKEACEWQKKCSNFASKLCCCKFDECNGIYADDMLNLGQRHLENNATTFISKFPSPSRPRSLQHLNFVTIGILVVTAIGCIILYFPVMASINSSIKSLIDIQEFYMDHVHSGASAVKTAKKVNKALRQTLFLEELTFRLNSLRRFEELSSETLVLNPRQKNTKVLHKLETDPQFLYLIKSYALARIENQKRRAILRRRKNQCNNTR